MIVRINSLGIGVSVYEVWYFHRIFLSFHPHFFFPILLLNLSYQYIISRPPFPPHTWLSSSLLPLPPPPFSSTSFSSPILRLLPLHPHLPSSTPSPYPSPPSQLHLCLTASSSSTLSYCFFFFHLFLRCLILLLFRIPKQSNFLLTGN